MPAKEKGGDNLASTDANAAFQSLGCISQMPIRKLGLLCHVFRDDPQAFS